VLEFSIVAPLIFAFFFAAFEYSRVSSLRQTAHQAAFEGARCGIVPGATTDQVRAHVAEVLAAVGARQATVTVTPATLSNTSPSVTVHISLPIEENSWVPLHFVGDTNLNAQCTLHREMF
jgi:Flp pilus assembly protein TadG